MTAPKYVVIEKPVGQTPLESITIWKDTHPQWSILPATYAGRLDPMASGKLLVLVGEECKRKDQYTGLDKEYEVEIVLDLVTDTGDALGLPTYAGAGSDFSAVAMADAIRNVTGSHEVLYPAFSSKTVNGVPLFMYALREGLGAIQIPTHLETIYKIQIVKSSRLCKSELQQRIQKDLKLAPHSDEPSKELGSDFRQHQIRTGWNELFESMSEREFSVLTICVTCASGTYMRTLAMRIANELGTTAFALSIHRTKIGRYRALWPLGFWSKRY